MADLMNDVFSSDPEQLAKMKNWFFKESVRINEEKEALNREKDRMHRENEIFEKKLEVLKNELFNLAKEKKELEQEKIKIKNLKDQTRSYSYQRQTGTTTFFKGVTNELALRKRYKDLLKIYHPDNMNGDTDTIQKINEEFRYLRDHL